MSEKIIQEQAEQIRELQKAVKRLESMVRANHKKIASVDARERRSALRIEQLTALLKRRG